MASTRAVKFDYDNLRKIVVDSYDGKIADAEANHQELADPARHAAAEAEWFGSQSKRITDFANVLKMGLGSANQMEEFINASRRSTNRPEAPDEYYLERANAEITKIVMQKERALKRIDAMVSDGGTIELTSTQLRDFFGV